MSDKKHTRGMLIQCHWSTVRAGSLVVEQYDDDGALTERRVAIQLDVPTARRIAGHCVDYIKARRDDAQGALDGIVRGAT